MLREIVNYSESIKGAIFPSNELRFVNWYIQYGCNLECSYCKVPKQKVEVMSQKDRKGVLQKVRNLCSKQPIISLLGGEPTLRPDFLVEVVSDANKAGFLVNVVSNGWGLTPDLIKRLGIAGLHYLGISVDCDKNTIKSNLEKALSLHETTKRIGVLPVINTVINHETQPETFKKFVSEVIQSGCFISPLACSPEIPGGIFSSAPIDSVPTQQQLREIVPWLAIKKLTTGRITSDFGYLWTLYNSGVTESGLNLWHCASHFRTKRESIGRGSITIDSDGHVGPCQEFPRTINLLNTPQNQFSLQLLDPDFSAITSKCPGCLYNCYVMEESIGGLQLLGEIPTFLQMASIKSNNRK
jgi:MoaA/NifB/PqqE/SkfB family radical SAM enzyme